MDLIAALQTTGTCRYYTQDPVADETLAAVLDAARWAPSGGNRQPVSLIAIRARATRQALQDLYLPLWDAYVAGIDAGTVRIGARDRRVVAAADHFAHHLADVPVLVVVCARLGDVHPTDTALGRLSIVGGASVYPAVQNMLLAARAAGLGTALTTLLCAVEPEVKALLDIPAEVATAAMVTLGWPARPFPRRLARRALAEMAWAERYGQPLRSPPAG